MGKEEIVWPRPKACEEEPRVKPSNYKDYENMKITDKQDGSNGKNLNS